MPREKFPDKDFIWTPNLAYVVGLLVTDGNLSKNGRSVIMRSAERCMLETFNTCLAINNKIGINSKNGIPYYRVQYGNVQFYRWLLKIGLCPRKSLIIGAVDVPDEFFRDYFRGCINGDGSIQTYVDGYNQYKGHHYTTQRLFINVVSGSQKHILWLQGKVANLAGVEGFITKSEPPDAKHATLWGLKFAKKKSLKIIEWMYYRDDIPCLERKRAVAQYATKIIQQQKRKKYEFL